jgi:hypothetical protein
MASFGDTHRRRVRGREKLPPGQFSGREFYFETRGNIVKATREIT